MPARAIVAGACSTRLQTVFAALSWLDDPARGVPRCEALPVRPVLASYAVAVALNGFLPANIGTLVMMVMFTSLIAGATFAAVLSGFVVQKIPFTVLNIAVYVYLFATVSGSLSFDFDLSRISSRLDRGDRRQRDRAPRATGPRVLAPGDEAPPGRSRAAAPSSASPAGS